jgi:pimeloyl-ACP methyl ester carboxylesterase
MTKAMKCPHLLVWIALFFASSVVAQTDMEINKLLLDKGFSRVTIKNGKKEPIDVIISRDTSTVRKPLLLFLQGSGAMSALNYQDGKLYVIALPFNPKPYLPYCNIAIINKAALSICDTTLKASGELTEAFMSQDYLDNYVQRAEQVLKYFKHERYVHKDSIFVVGHSQGYRVAAKLAATSKIPCKVVCMSANPFNRYAEGIGKYLYANGCEIENLSAVDSIYERSHSVQSFVGQYKTIERMPPNARNMVSFNSELSLTHLLKVKVPLLVVHGTDDAGSNDNLLLPIIFDANRKRNLTMLTKVGYDHNFWKTTNGGNPEKEFGWDEVFGEVFLWLLGRNGK